MHTKWMRVSAILAVLLVMVPLLASAQDDTRRGRTERSRNWPRGEIQITNDWENDVKVTLWTHRREQISSYWSLEPGVTNILAMDGARIKVRPNYKIKVGDDWGWVDVGDVAHFAQGTWYVNVRDIWRATHQRRDHMVPDWKS